ncbi:MAG TPA: membrane protein insertase YidC [Rhodospirillales bacterium]|nr:membrane protein insertase YidC [Rhodospirillales bacterium]
MNDNKNLVLAVVFSVVILLSYEFYASWRYPPVPLEDQAISEGQSIGQAATVPSVPTSSASGDVQIPSLAGSSQATVAVPVSSEVLRQQAREVLAKSPRVTIEGDRVHGSLSLRGGRIDDLTLSDYRETLDDSSPPIVLLSPSGTKGAYFTEYGWVGNGISVPNENTLWKASTTTLRSDRPVTLRWDNGEGLTFERIITIDENYMFSITQRVINKGTAPVTLHPYGLISRHGTPNVSTLYILHEGLLGVFDGTLQEVDYDDLREDKNVITNTTTGGWLGITDKYWLVALVPDQKTSVTTNFGYRKSGDLDKYQADFLGAAVAIAPGTSGEVVSHLFTGAKEVKKLDAYEEAFGIARFDLAIDFGWFYFLTKPIFYTLIWIEERVGNFGIAILLLTVLIKLLFFPLANKSYKAMSKMKKLQPEMVKLRERFADDKMALNKEMMALYKREKANPAAGCLPMVVQIPVFFSLYKVLYVTIEMRQAPFFGWIQDLSIPDPTNVFELFGLIEWGAADVLPQAVLIGFWPLLMGLTMFLQQRLNPPPADPTQAKIFMFLPILFTFMLARFPAGLVIYWAWNNSLSILQQKTIMYRMGVK